MRLQPMLATFLGTITACAGLPEGDPQSGDPIGGDDEEGEQLSGPIAPGKAAVVFAHGFGGTADAWDPAIKTAIEADGHAVLFADVPPTGSVKSRAAALGPQVDAFLADTTATQVHIIAHSMGGLDSRYLISTMGYGPKVASLTTISTPHQGTPLADVARGIQDGDQAAALDALVALAELAGLVDQAELEQALIDLSEANAATFAAANPDAQGVTYQSYAGLSAPFAAAVADSSACGATEVDNLRPLLYLPFPVVTGTDLDANDGVVSVASATYGSFQGCISADHIDETGMAALIPTTVDIPAFYKGIVTKLVP